MNGFYPVFTKENECQDCYKCIRHCPAKAIKLKNGSASVIPELCVACGRCVKVCPAGAKQIRSDVDRVKYLLEKGEKLILSLAPSWKSAFKNVSEAQMVSAMKKLGFFAVSETALGAQIVSAHVADAMKRAPSGIFLSTACPAAVEYIRKYIPEYSPLLTEMTSPVGAHAVFLKERYGSDVKVIFAGPCAAKKLEADDPGSGLEIALTFKRLNRWLTEEGIDLNGEAAAGAAFEPVGAEEGRLYAFEGGMVETVRSLQNDEKTVYLTVSGLNNMDRLLSGSVPQNTDVKLFIECLACEGGCVNGPGMPGRGDRLEDILRIARPGCMKSSENRKDTTEIRKQFTPEPIEKTDLTPEQVKAGLEAIGKRNPEDELNCGGCGYQTCRNFVAAVASGKAEKEMCVSYLKRLAQNKSNALIKYIPSAVVIVDKNLKVVECNKQFASLMDDEGTRLAYEASPGLEHADLRRLIPFSDLFEAALRSGEEVLRNNYVVQDKIFRISIFNVDPHRQVGAIITDMTKNELQREQIAQKARKVIEQNVFTVQKIANYLGEHMAETEILLREVAEGFEGDHKESSAHDDQ